MNHILYSVEEISSTIGGKSFVENPDSQIRTLLTDSRKLTDTEKGIFFALKGRRHGHTFIKDAYDAGVRNFVISDETIDRSSYSGSNFYIVEDTLKSLQDLAAHHRLKFSYPVIGITGSNGKTVVKEWLYQLLAPENNIVRSPRSFNSQIGVPLSVWEMNEENNLGIFEAGISRKGEMENLAKVIRPSIGIFTNIGEAHYEGFENTEEKIKEKLKLFEDVDTFIYSCKYLGEYAGELPGKNRFTWCYRDKADLDVFDDEVLEGKFQFLRARYNGEDIEALIPFTDQASIENGIICWATLLAMGYEPEEADRRLAKLLPVNMRLELKNGINNCSLIDDSYSLDLSSLAIALDFLQQQNQHLRRTLILSDIPGDTLDPLLIYEKVARLLENKSVDRLIAIGPHIKKYAAEFNVETIFFEDTDELISKLPSLKLANETILLKGARAYEFERISALLTHKVHETILEINLTAVEHNLNYYKTLLNPGVKIMAIVKAFSYGSGSFEIANLLEFNKVDYLAVAYADEGVSLRKDGITLPIMVMNPDVMAFETIIENSLEPEIYSFRIFEEFLEVLNRKNISHYPVHIKLDTGMHRLGFEEKDIVKLIGLLSETDAMRVESIFSHLVASEDESEDDLTKEQVKKFEQMSGMIKEKLAYPLLRHVLNTSGISRFPDSQFDLVRLGIGLYGIDSSNKEGSPLQTVTSLKTSISQIKEIRAGETVGYGSSGKMPQGGKIATVKIGYADGYSRALSNGVGKMLINGKQVPTVGKICMDMCMLDVTGLNVSEGDEVIVFNNEIRVEDIAKKINTIPYEILTGISQRVKRVYYYE
ncbi:bifunctional UDP-N-acetylmuramoyl-tripeptide:D-alanyl-D-alanine ligase/alanine racemase [Daejeonella oryzae]|uniref:bifunctional UDP-N-acetylmuramoyl-tripeptide:D-alanyl-D-alanine ligase/alanine racemase n=1 Tax=Daejeonella oryzae TaxID=1122943 RepID=UPI0003F4B2CD|nr:bifunctional UDP-N-acetylmuramoyl-tripeptide:D-alanyl-D-alanine ligase/alanine racemase [Daejeonella oryzae]